jgi:hypothetical protein
MIKFFGCSFTEGGGLNNIDYYNYIESPTTPLTYWPEGSTPEDRVKIVEFLDSYKEQNRFTNILEISTKTPIINLAKSQASNDYILESLFKEIDENENDVYFVILSLLHRRYWHYEIDKQKHNLNMSEFSGNPFDNRESYRPLYNHFKNYLEYIFDVQTEKNSLVRNIQLFDSFAKSKGSKIIWSGWDFGDDVSELKLEFIQKVTQNCLLFDGLSLKHFCIKEGLQIEAETNGLVPDNHISKYGNIIVAKKIEEYIIKNKLL